MSNTAERESLFTPAEIQDLTQGTLFIQGKREIHSVVIDSREAVEGSLFVPLAGTRVDGHQFLEDALRRRASAVLVEGSGWEKKQVVLHPLAKNKQASVIIVNDTLKALQSLAKYHMRRHANALRIGITGSNGKTTTKEILGAILSQEGQTITNKGNLNSEIGVPLSVFQMTGDHKFAVFEMGMNHAGEMDILTDIIRPDCALITNIGMAHIGLLGSREAIAQEKKKVFHYFTRHQKAFLYEGEKFLPFLSKELKAMVILYGPESTKGYEGSESLGLDGTVIHWEGLLIHFPLFGFHNLLNALAALSVSIELEINKKEIRAGLEAVQPLFGRSQIIRGPVTIIQDCYNSNPDSVSRLFEFFKPLEWQGRKIVILGSMLELGKKSKAAHRRIGLEAGKLGFDMILLFGEEMESAHEALRIEGYSGLFDWTSDFDTLRSRLINFIRPGDLILLKGSRGVEMERLLPDLAKFNRSSVEG